MSFVGVAVTSVTLFTFGCVTLFTRLGALIDDFLTETPKVETKNVKSLLKDYPRDGFSLILLPLLLLEAGVKEGLKLAGVLA